MSATAATSYVDEIAASARELFARAAPADGLLERLRSEDVSRAAWEGAAEVGFFRLLTGERAGGLGAGPAELAALFREIGRALPAGPWVETVVAGGLLRDFADLGADTAVIAYADAARPAAPVDFATQANVLAVRSAGSIGLVVGAPTAPLRSFDLAGRPARVDLAAAAVEPLLAGDEADAVAGRISALARVARAAELGGLAAAVLDMGVSYAKERVQFEKPIGSFQAVQHRLAEMAVTTTAIDSAVDAIVGLTDSGEAGAGAEAEAAALYLYAAGEARSVALSCLQVHGGIGFTAEHPLHAYLKRVLRLQAIAGAGDPLAALGRRLLAG